MFSKRLLVAVSPGREEASVLSLARTLGVLGARVTLAHVPMWPLRSWASRAWTRRR